jgi:hypothetical protein
VLKKEIKMKSKTITTALIVSALATGLLSGPANALDKPKVQQSITWAWEDGADRGHRDFSEDDYDTVEEIPTVNVTVLPASVGRRVILETLDSATGTWAAEKISRTDALGVAKLRINPLCQKTSVPMWCDHDSTYRIRVLKSGTQRQSLSSQFVVSFVTSETDTF